jgi:hypothetical protein
MRAEFTVWGTSAKAAKSGDPPDVHFIMYDSSSKTKPPPRWVNSRATYALLMLCFVTETVPDTLSYKC